jgi:thioesterase domain-containing protein
MASTLNAFELLQQAGGLPSGNKTKKKKKNKKPAAAKEVEEAPAVQEQATVDAEIAPEATAVPILEKSARTFKTGGDRIKLWKDWIRQVRQQRVHVAVPYATDCTHPPANFLGHSFAGN